MPSTSRTASNSPLTISRAASSMSPLYVAAFRTTSSTCACRRASSASRVCSAPLPRRRPASSNVKDTYRAAAVRAARLPVPRVRRYRPHERQDGKNEKTRQGEGGDSPLQDRMQKGRQPYPVHGGFDLADRRAGPDDVRRGQKPFTMQGKQQGSEEEGCNEQEGAAAGARDSRITPAAQVAAGQQGDQHDAAGYRQCMCHRLSSRSDRIRHGPSPPARRR